MYMFWIAAIVSCLMLLWGATSAIADCSGGYRNYSRYVVEGDRPIQCRRADWYSMELNGWVFISYNSWSEVTQGGASVGCDPINAGRSTALTWQWTDKALKRISQGCTVAYENLGMNLKRAVRALIDSGN
jgi:hypothetical protein